MLAKLVKAFGLLRDDFRSLKCDVQRLEKVRSIVKHGVDGVSPDPEDIISAVLDRIPEAKDGVSPSPEAIAKKIPIPKRGEPGKNGVSVTDIQLNNNELFVFLDGKKNSVGKIKMLTPSAPFNPGNTGGSARSTGSADNAFYISTASEFPQQDDTTITLRTSDIYVITKSFISDKRFVCEDGSFITWRNLDAYTITYSGVGLMFSGIDANFAIKEIGLDCPLVQIFNSLSVGVFKDLFLTQFINSGAFNTESGILIEGVNNNTVSISRLFQTINKSGGVALDFGTSEAQVNDIGSMVTFGVAGAIGISGLSNSGNVPPSRRTTVNDSEFSSGIIPLVGITPSDVRWEFKGNNPIKDSITAGDIYLAGGSETVLIITAGVFAEIGTPVTPGVTWESGISRFTIGVDGAITYIGERDIDLQVSGVATVQKVGGGTDEIEVRVAKNWTPGSSGILQSRAITQNNTPTSVPLSAIVSLTNGDNIWVIFANNTSTADIIAQVTNFKVTE